MREIKFRAFLDGRMGEPFYPFDPVFMSAGGTFPEGTILMQFTGLKDKADMEIYEGDIIIPSFEEYFIVIWEGNGWKIKSVKGKSKPASLRGSGKRIRVVGNIYQNPELLKQ